MSLHQPGDAEIVVLRPWRSADPVDAPTPAHPFFFGSGVLHQEPGRRVLEQGLLDAFATIALKFRAEWTSPGLGRAWRPGAEALAGLLMLRLAVARETVVVATREAEDSRLPACALDEARRVIEGQEFYENRTLRQHAPGACARMARVHAEALESEHTAFLVAARLHEVWSIGEEALRAPREAGLPAEILPFPERESRSFEPEPRESGAPSIWRWMGAIGRSEGPVQ
ncbi:MAG TPA: hypothetical protein PKB04_05645 [Phenylobacterium sp.]|nr:hypothetical protein [Phenylobacterium sp.]